ncbi:MAG: hypothetical protein ACK5KR_01465 [Breznakia sp.]
MQFGVGVKEEIENVNGFEVPLRYYGSGGGLYSIRPYVFINNAENVEPGIYKYQPFSHTIRRIEHEDVKMQEAFSSQMSKIFPIVS